MSAALRAGSRRRAPPSEPAARPPQPGVGWALPRPFYLFLGVLVLFTLGNSADAFLLLRLGDSGVPAPAIPLLWAALHVVKAVSSIAGGARSDKVGRRRVIGAGWMIYAIVYGGFATAGSPTVLIAWFLVYGLYYGLTEGAEKALIADLAPPTVAAPPSGSTRRSSASAACWPASVSA